MYADMGCLALITATVLCAMSHDSLLSMSVRRVHVVSRLPDLRAEENRPPKTSETAALRRDTEKDLAD